MPVGEISFSVVGHGTKFSGKWVLLQISKYV